jgi:NTE family protein
MPEKSESKEISLVLSSGGARGLAHIGVIERLEEEGFEIKAISGSSIGAVVGAFYACGELETYKNWACKLDRLDVFKLIDFTFSVSGFIRGEKVFKALEDLIADRPIESLPIPYSAVAVDLHNKKEVVINQGSMYGAIKASVAIPTVIKPTNYKGMELIDGGVMNPLPIKYVQKSQGHLLVVSNVNANIPYDAPNKSIEKDKELLKSYQQSLDKFKTKWGKLLPGSKETKEKLGYFELLTRSVDLMQDKLTELIIQQHNPQINISISRDACNTFEFYRASELIEAGRQTFDKAYDAFLNQDEQ